MKLFSAQQLKEADRLTVEKQGISYNELMDKAGRLVFEKIDQRLQGRRIPVKVFCGVGNNGGDGLVVARLLLEAGYGVTVYIVNYSDKRSKDFLINYERIKNITRNWPVLLKPETDFPELHPTDVVVDAVFGIGLNRPLVDWVGNLIKHLNASGAFVFAIDTPSGMFTDAPKKEKDSIVMADVTFTFESAKLVFFLPQTGPFVGGLEVLELGLDKEYLKAALTDSRLIEKKEAAALYIPRKKYSHKGSYGHALLIGGSYGKMGSICLTATATLRSGAGMASVYTPRCGYEIVQTALPEAMVITDAATDFISDIQFDLEPSVICFGVGVGKKKETLEAFKKLLRDTQNPMVIDADGLNLLSENPEIMEMLPKNSVLTPHPKELERLIGAWDHDFEKLEKAQELAKQNEVLVVLKGAHSITLTGEERYINSTGNPGMASAGSGDVLAGVITGLISQGYESLTASVLGVYLHGKAGDMAARKLGFQGLLARDIAAQLGPAFLELLE